MIVISDGFVDRMAVKSWFSRMYEAVTEGIMEALSSGRGPTALDFDEIYRKPAGRIGSGQYSKPAGGKE